MRFKTTRAHPLVRSFMAASLAGVELCATEEGVLCVKGASVTDEEGLAYPVEWAPFENVSQLEQIEMGRRISSFARADGVWLSCIYDAQGMPHHAAAGVTRAHAVVQTALLEKYGPVLEVGPEQWETITSCIPEEEGVERNAAALTGVELPFFAFETVEMHSGGKKAWTIGTLTVESKAIRPDGTLEFQGTDRDGRGFRMESKDLCLSLTDAAEQILKVAQVEGPRVVAHFDAADADEEQEDVAAPRC